MPIGGMVGINLIKKSRFPWAWLLRTIVGNFPEIKVFCSLDNGLPFTVEQFNLSWTRLRFLHLLDTDISQKLSSEITISNSRNLINKSNFIKKSMPLIRPFSTNSWMWFQFCVSGSNFSVCTAEPGVTESDSEFQITEYSSPFDV